MQIRAKSFAWLGLALASAAALLACGGGSSSAPSTPPIANVRGPGQFLSAQALGTIAQAEISQAVQASGGAPSAVAPRYAVRTWRLTYRTTDGQGQEITASALIGVPQKSGASPVMAYQHGTTTRDAEAPSNHAVAAEPAVVMAAHGYIVLAADYVGYGASKGAPHPYLLAAPSAAAVVDLLTAARYWRQVEQVAGNGQLFLAGYSEGAYATMAAQRALQQGASAHRAELVAVAPGAGPYNVVLTMNALLDEVRSQNAVLGALINPGFLRYLSGGARDEVRNQLLRELLGSDADVQFQTDFLDKFLADDSAGLAQVSNVHDWLPQTAIHLFHGRGDQTVPYANASAALQAMQARGAGNLVSVSDCSANPSGHLDCVRPWWGFTLQRFATVARDL